MDVQTQIIGFLFCIVLAIMLMVGWAFNQDGVLTASVLMIIGLIAGAVFGFEYAKK